jgi:hypothetical protein
VQRLALLTENERPPWGLHEHPASSAPSRPSPLCCARRWKF